MLTSIMYTTVYVTDQDRALKFYTEGLGLETRVDQTNAYGRFLTVGVGDSPVEILLWSLDAHPGLLPEGVTAPGPLILESEDLRRDFEEFRERGVPFDGPAPVDYPFGIRAEATDPDGNRISLRQRNRAAGADS